MANVAKWRIVALVPVIERLANRLGFTRLVRETAASYSSAWTDNSHLAEIAFETFYGEMGKYIPASRSNAMRIGSVANLRHLITGMVSRLPLFAKVAGARAEQQPGLLSQMERGTPIATTLQWIVDDLIFYPHSWLVVRERDFYRWPTWVERVPQGKARFNSDGWLIGIEGENVKAEDVIRIDSPLGAGLLVNAAEPIKRAIALELAAAIAEDNPVPTVELHDEGGNEALTEDEIEKLLDRWSSARRRRGVAYTPKRIKVIPHGQHTAQLLIDGRKAIELTLVRHMNAPAWSASNAVEGATMTYDNRALRNWELIDITLHAYTTAIDGRLSLADVTPRGWVVDFELDELTRPDQKTRFETYAIGKKHGFITDEWIAEQEGWTTTGGSR